LIAAGTDTGLVRAENEDSHCAVDLRPKWPGYAVAVADGMGGYEAGEIASALAIEAFAAAVQEGLQRAAAGQPDGGGLATSLLQALVRDAVGAAHSAVRAEATARNVERMGSTLTAALVCPDGIVWGHIGDSRLYRVRGGEAMQMSNDHSVV